MIKYATANGEKKSIKEKAMPAFLEMCNRIELHKTTGSVYLMLNVNQGGLTGVKIGTEDCFKIDQ